jgi:hypothetical protein
MTSDTPKDIGRKTHVDFGEKANCVRERGLQSAATIDQG